ncbi:hypothetical protein A3I34_00010 [Candidatus Jorgensenbacteria bacterium RIFCSPLOWO2_02_FULL_45_12]|uniref:Four helix bundle protein n=2 Tax=Candidatus Joergenseniibacteriota TaxID=1752739 RepID=A0A1F6BQM8_9BACT|nr:MAG: hypothetical protein UX22_C0028G0015 [Candidatus Jorgensenbacteria bacterium GW2011_GWA2_45_9]OGG39230.1 MAG: hypothetical protein A3D55_01020 [Candidatus Jorgensenbacteria bacterium RIFCSPHIGHO2_02_FULL_45_20]OGG42522.1 MAG: hypothetical protein A3I34_00010 [Candidatus Jorgensenbacteria bacterium RIFCSPLOWO2_02_FULL_45_12]
MYSFPRKSFAPKKPIRSFRDLDVYTKTLECAVDVVKKFSKSRILVGFSQRENMSNCALSIPLYISEGHSVRFGDKKTSLVFLEKAMAGCNKMVVYLEEIRGIYGEKVSSEIIEELVKKYIDVRVKIFRLSKAWQKNV